MIKKLAAFFLLLTLLPIPACTLQEHLFASSRFIMDTLIEVKISGLTKEEAGQAAELVFDEFIRIDKLMSRYQEASSVTSFNNRGENSYQVTPEVYRLLKKAVMVSKLSKGAFDVTIEPIITLYDFDERTPKIPSTASLKKALTHTGYQKIHFEDDFYIRADDPALRLDLGGIAKGYALEQAADILKDKGVKAFLINAGGDIITHGLKKDGSKWRLGIRNPRGLGIIGSLELTDSVVVTSGDYERFFFQDGIRYHHLLDPRNGQVSRLCRSVTVIYKDAALADAYATAIFVLGPKDGLQLARQVEGLKVLIIDADGKITTEGGFTYEAKQT